MQRVILTIVAVHISFLTGRLLAGDQPTVGDELARILRANPAVAIDKTAASGEYCFNSGLGTMVHFATEPERTKEDVVYEFDASGLIGAGLDTTRLQQLPERGQMTPGVWYFLPRGQQDPHHGH